MGNEEEKKTNNDADIQSINDSKQSTQKSKDFQRFRDIVLNYEYYTKLLKLSFRNNKILKILYKREGIFNSYYKQILSILENITYVNYKECIDLSKKESNSSNKIGEKNIANNNYKKYSTKVRFYL